MRRTEGGSLPLESIPAILLVLLTGVGVMQVVLTLYGANMLRASAHEAARAAVARHSTGTDARRAAIDLVRAAAGGIVDGLRVRIAIDERTTHRLVRVHVSGKLVAPGPIPVAVPITATATASKEWGPL